MSDGKDQTAPLGLGKLASQVGAMFARDYYAALIRGDMFAWYGEDSLFVHQDEGWKPSEENTVVGHMTIHNKIRELGYAGWRVVVDTMDAQMTHGDNILLLVTGNFVKADRQRPFSQTFLLSPLPGGDAGYYIRNDVLHYHGPNVARVVAAAPVNVAAVVVPSVAAVSKQATPKVVAVASPSTPSPAPLDLATQSSSTVVSAATPNSIVDAAPASGVAAAAANGEAKRAARAAATRAKKADKPKKPKVKAVAATETKEADSNGVTASSAASVASVVAPAAAAAAVVAAPVVPSKPPTWAAMLKQAGAANSTSNDTNGVVISPNSVRGAKAGRGRGGVRGGVAVATQGSNGVQAATSAIATGTPIVAKKAAKRAATALATATGTTGGVVAAATPVATAAAATAATDANKVDPKVRASVEAGTALFIGGLPAGTDEAAVRTLLTPFGNTLAVTFVKDKAFCYVEMTSAAIAEAILAAGHAKTLRLGDEELIVKKRRITNRDRAGVTGSARGSSVRGGASYRGTRGGARGRGATTGAATNVNGTATRGARANGTTRGGATARATSAPAAAATTAAV